MQEKKSKKVWLKSLLQAKMRKNIDTVFTCMHTLEPLFIFFHHFFPFSFYFIPHLFDLLPFYFDFFPLFFLHSTRIPWVFFSFFFPASHSLSHPPCLLCPLPLATSLLWFSLPVLFPPGRLADALQRTLINEGLCPSMIAQREWHHVIQSFLHISEGKSRTFLSRTEQLNN